MHPCLQIDEVLRQITFELKTFSIFTCRDLLSMALSCKTFYEPAMDELWGFMGDVRALISCLPEDARQVRFVKSSFERNPDLDVIVCI